MDEFQSCPSEVELTFYLRGKLGPTAIARLEAHLLTCAPCAQTVEWFHCHGLPAQGDDDSSASGSKLASDSAPDLTIRAGSGATRRMSHDPQLQRLLKPSPTGEYFGEIGQYQILRLVGGGGIGYVFRARDPRLGRVVAIKILRERFARDDKQRARFEREARAAGRINDQHVVTLHTVSEDDGIPYLVMEYIDGTTLEEHIRCFGPLSYDEILELARQLILGLRAAHRVGIVHRDIKPGNILLGRKPAQLYITDFGLARVAFDGIDLTSKSMAMGTPAFMSPEQVRGDEDVDARADLFGLGVVLYSMVAGGSPFESTASLETARRVLEDVPQPLDAIAPDLPKPFADLVQKLLQKNRDDRFQSAAETLRAVQDLIDHRQREQREARDAEKSASARNAVPPQRRFRSIGWGVAVVALIATGAILVRAMQTPPKDAQTRKPPEAQPPETQLREIPPRKIGTSATSKIMTVAQDGSADYDTLEKALAEAEPGSQIVVVDDGVYRCALQLGGIPNHQGVRLSARGRAVLTPAAADQPTLRLRSAQDVSIRGFRIVAPAAQHALLIQGESNGLVIEDIEFQQDETGVSRELLQLHLSAIDPASRVAIKNCRFLCRGGQSCVRIHGEPTPYPRVSVEGNHFQGEGTLLLVFGSGCELDMCRNVFVGGRNAINLQLRQPVDGEAIKIWNNSFFESRFWLGLVDSDAGRSSISVCNNLIIGGERIQGSDQQLDAAATHWELRSNWWERGPQMLGDPTRNGSFAELKEDLLFESRAPSSDQFLVPAVESPLLGAGAGGDLPGYVGARKREESCPP